MKKRVKLAFLALVVGSLLTAMTVVILSQRETIRLARHQNRVLHEQNRDLNARVAALIQENLRFSEALQASEVKARSGRGEFIELLRLRNEVGQLRAFVREAKQAQEKQMQAGETDSPGAERALESARAELLKAQAEAERAMIAGIELRKAVVEFTRAADLYSKSLIGRTEFDSAAASLESARTSLREKPF